MEITVHYIRTEGLRYDEARSELHYLDRFKIQLNSNHFSKEWMKAFVNGEGQSLESTTQEQMFLLEELANNELLEFILSIDRKKTLQAYNLRLIPKISSSLAPERYRLLPSAALRMTKTGMTISHPLALSDVTILDLNTTSFIVSLMQDFCDSSSVSENEKSLLLILNSLGLIESSQVTRSGSAAFWEHSDLIFHSHSQRKALLKSGATLRKLENLPNPIPLYDSNNETGIDLSLTKKNSKISQLTDLRKTTRGFSSRIPLTFQKLSEFLVTSLSPVNGTESHWPWPGPGNVYNLHFYVLINSLEDLSPGVYRFDPRRRKLFPKSTHSTDRLVLSKTTDSYLTTGIVPPVVLIITADYPVLARIYEKICYRVLLITTGTILQNFYLSAAAIGLGIRPIGSLDVKLIEDNLLGLEKLREIYMLHVELGALDPVNE